MIRVDAHSTVLSIVSPSPVIIRDGSKAGHIREIEKRTDIAASGMLFFDDNAADIAQVAQLGATAIHCPHGLTDACFAEGLETFARSYVARASSDGLENGQNTRR